MLIAILQFIDGVFTHFIFVPILFMLAYRFFPNKFKGQRYKCFYRVCAILIFIFLIRYLMAKFIFTEINQHRFTDSGLFPLIEAIFYQNL